MSNNLDHWSNYWKGGRLTSLPQDFRENYEGEIESFWKSVFSELSSHSEILDLCTGNGAIALLASSFSGKNKLELNITAVDAAKIEISNLTSKYDHLKNDIQNINFIGECRVENIDLQSDKFDLITSQYGIEYCDWNSSAAQVSRLLKPGGSFVLISHASDTDIVVYMSEEREEYNTLEDLGFFLIFNNYLSRRKSYKETIRSLKKLNKSLIRIMQQKNSSLISGIVNFINYLTTVEKRIFLSQEREMKSHFQQHVFAYARLKDVLDVTKKISDNPDWYLVFEDEGLELKEKGKILYQGVHNAGMFYKFCKLENSKRVDN